MLRSTKCALRHRSDVVFSKVTAKKLKLWSLEARRLVWLREAGIEVSPVTNRIAQEGVTLYMYLFT